MGVRFGTDGIRGVANSELGVELVLALGRAAARVLPSDCFVVGRDTRRSGPLLQAALSAGLASEGADVVDLGVLPTPAVAWVAADRGVPAAVVSASHNEFADNGVKLFAAGGLKLADSVEQAVEEELEAALAGPMIRSRPPTGRAVGVLRAEPGCKDGYVEHLVSSAGGAELSGLHVVVDCANGAASTVAADVLGRLGVRVDALFADPDGTNINAHCGSTHPETLIAEVRGRRADVGLALDGDADRLLAVDHTGALVSGDELLAMFARDRANRGCLPGNAVVVTVMSNLGLHLAMAEQGIAVRQTPVGDRYVLEALESENLALGGEQSGHIVFRDLATTGDGLLTAVLLLELLGRSGRSLADLAGESMVRLPQVLCNVAVGDPRAVMAAPEVQEALEQVGGELGDRGRVLLRASGTEPVVRVMVEAPDQGVASAAADRLAAVVTRAATARPPTGAGAPGAAAASGAPAP